MLRRCSRTWRFHLSCWWVTRFKTFPRGVAPIVWDVPGIGLSSSSLVCSWYDAMARLLIRGSKQIRKPMYPTSNMITQITIITTTFIIVMFLFSYLHWQRGQNSWARSLSWSPIRGSTRPSQLHLLGGTLSINGLRPVSAVLLKTAAGLGHTHLQRLFSKVPCSPKHYYKNVVIFSC